MQFGTFSFGAIQIDGVKYHYDVGIEGGEVGKRKKKPSKKFHDDYGHTPLSIHEQISLGCRRLVNGTWAFGSLPVMKEVRLEAERCEVELGILPTAEAVKTLEKDAKTTNAILDVTC